MNNLYLLLGKDTGLKNKKIETILNIIKKKDENYSKIKFYLNQKEDVLNFIGSINQNSLFSNISCYIIYNTDELSVKDSTLLCKLLKESQSEDYYIFLSDENKIDNTTLTSLIPKTNTEVFYEMFQNKKVPYIIDFLKKYNIFINSSDAEYFLSLIENTTDIIDKTLLQIKDYILDKNLPLVIDNRLIDKVLTLSKENSTFEVIRYIAQKKTKEAVSSIRGIIQNSSYITVFPSFMYSLKKAYETILNDELSTIRNPQERDTIYSFKKNYSINSLFKMINILVKTEQMVRENDTVFHKMIFEKMIIEMINS